MNKKQLSILLLSLLFLFTSLYADEKVKIYIASGKYGDYYHILFSLTPDNTLLTLKGYYKYGPSEYKFEEDSNYGGGCFQVFIPKDKFPIAAPNCKGYIILRMPWTEKGKISDNEYSKYVDEKKGVFKSIKKMVDCRKGSVDVVIELNESEAGIVVRNKNPIELELTGCNVWFRQAHGRYISYIGQLKE